MICNSISRCWILYLLTIIYVVHTQDIFDMFNNVKGQVVDAASNVKEQVQKHVLNHKDGETCSSSYATEYRTVLTAYRHLIRDWLEKFPSKNADKYRLLVELSSNEFNRLEQFAASSNYDQKTALRDVHAISDILKRILYEIEEDKLVATGLTWSAWLRSFDINIILKGVLAVIVVAVISSVSIRTHFRRGRWFSTFFIVVFVVSVIQNWYTLYLEAQAKVDEVLMKQMPKHCQGHSMGFFDTVKAKFGRFFQIPENECLAYHKALRATPHSQVTPVQAFSMTFAQLFVTPLGVIGESLSQFFAGTMRYVPTFLWPIIIIIIVFVFIFVILMYSRYEVHLPFMMGSLRPSRYAAVSTRTDLVQQLDGSSNQVKELEDRIKQLQTQLESSPPPIGFRDVDLL